MIYGYARVSSKSQCFNGQVDALKAAGCDEIVSEKVSGKDIDGRKALQGLLAKVREGDVIIVHKLDRWARSVVDLLSTLDDLSKRGVGFKSLGDSWCDTTTASGRFVMTVMGGMAEFQRSLIRERCAEGIARAKAEGRHLGRTHALNPHQRQRARELLEAGETQRSVARLLGVGQATIGRLAAEGASPA